MMAVEEPLTRLPLDIEDEYKTPTPHHVDWAEGDRAYDAPQDLVPVSGGDVGGETPGGASSRGPRMPRLQSQPMMARTPSHLLPEDLRPEGVLITELYQEEDEEERPVVEYTEVPQPEEEEEEEEPRPEGAEYDTDLENEEEEETLDRQQLHYHKVCGQLSVVPISYFTRHIHDPTLTMRFHGLDDQESMAIALALRETVDVERLDLSGNWMGPEGAKCMARLCEENEYLTEVGLADNRLGNEGSKYLCHMLRTNGGLRKLVLKGNEFDDNSVPYFAEALENNKYLKELDLSHNRFSPGGAEVLGHAIGQNENLDVLDLSWNHLRPSGGVSIAKGIKENVRLKKLSLAWNGLGLEGGNAVADALLANQALLEIDLTGNRLGLHTAKKMAKVLTSNDSIRVLKMGNNLITSGGAIALITAINNTEHCEVEELDLTDVEVEYEFLRVLEDTKQKRPNFTCKYGLIMRAGNTVEDLGKRGIDAFKQKPPVVIMQEHIEINDMRLIDILKRYDDTGAHVVSPESFIAALQELAVPYNKAELEKAVHNLADSQSGKIHFGDFVQEPTPMSSRPVSQSANTNS